MSVAIIVPLLLAVCFPLAAGDTSSDQKLDEVLEQLRQIRAMLENNQAGNRRLPTSAATVDINGALSLGSEKAPVAVVEFMDFECPYCKEFYARTFPAFKKIFIDTGKVVFYVVDFPLDRHAGALATAGAVRCAADQGKYWEMFDKVESRASPASAEEEVSNLARAVGLDMPEFSACVKSQKHKGEIESGSDNAAKSGIRGTPTFVIGKNTASAIHGEMVVGAMPLGVLQTSIQKVQ
jgi:protein-disulfide isomerase